MQLPEYLSQPLTYSPLVLVAAQINFEEIGRGVEHEQVRNIQRALGPEWASLAAAPKTDARRGGGEWCPFGCSSGSG